MAFTLEFISWGSDASENHEMLEILRLMSSCPSKAKWDALPCFRDVDSFDWHLSCHRNRIIRQEVYMKRALTVPQPRFCNHSLLSSVLAYWSLCMSTFKALINRFLLTFWFFMSIPGAFYSLAQHCADVTAIFAFHTRAEGRNLRNLRQIFKTFLCLPLGCFLLMLKCFQLFPFHALLCCRFCPGLHFMAFSRQCFDLSCFCSVVQNLLCSGVHFDRGFLRCSFVSPDPGRDSYLAAHVAQETRWFFGDVTGFVSRGNLFRGMYRTLDSCAGLCVLLWCLPMLMQYSIIHHDSFFTSVYFVAVWGLDARDHCGSHRADGTGNWSCDLPTQQLRKLVSVDVEKDAVAMDFFRNFRIPRGLELEWVAWDERVSNSRSAHLKQKMYPHSMSKFQGDLSVIPFLLSGAFVFFLGQWRISSACWGQLDEGIDELLGDLPPSATDEAGNHSKWSEHIWTQLKTICGMQTTEASCLCWSVIVFLPFCRRFCASHATGCKHTRRLVSYFFASLGRWIQWM